MTAIRKITENLLNIGQNGLFKVKKTTEIDDFKRLIRFFYCFRVKFFYRSILKDNGLTV